MDTEKTILDQNEETVIDSQNNNVSSQQEASEKTASTNKQETQAQGGSVWKKVAVGGVTGIVFGAGATLLTSGIIDNEAEEQAPHNPVVDDEIPFATTVDDDMSFQEAFDAAREEVGAGGVFEWHGNLYSTYTAEEWENMPQSEREEYASHFDWSKQEPQTVDYASNDNESDTSHDVAHHTTSHHQAEAHSASNTTSHHQAETHDASNTTGHQGETSQEVEVVGVQQESEVEVLGVVHDADSGANIAGVLVEDQEVLLIDVDGDHQFDIAATDVNQDGQISSDEAMDIQNQGLTVEDLGGFTNSPDNIYASNDETDYINDVSEV